MASHEAGHARDYCPRGCSACRDNQSATFCAEAEPDSDIASLASDVTVKAAATDALLLSNKDQGAKASDPASAKLRPPKVVPISVFVSRHLGRLFVRKGFTSLFDVPITIRNRAEPIGTHVFSVLQSQDDAAIRWTVVSIPEKSALVKDAPPRLHKEPPMPDKANAVLERLDIPKDVVDRISELLTPGSSLIISDQGISHETGRDTDFIVLTH